MIGRSGERGSGISVLAARHDDDDDDKTRDDWVRKVIYCEFCNKFKFDPTNKWYMHNPKSVQEKETHKVF